jgi:hypothetical protein
MQKWPSRRTAILIGAGKQRLPLCHHGFEIGRKLLNLFATKECKRLVCPYDLECCGADRTCGNIDSPSSCVFLHNRSDKLLMLQLFNYYNFPCFHTSFLRLMPDNDDKEPVRLIL